MSHQYEPAKAAKEALALPKFLTQQEVADMLRKQISWLERKRREGGGPPFRYMGRTPIYDLNDVLTWIEAQPLAKHTSDSVLY